MIVLANALKDWFTDPLDQVTNFYDYADGGEEGEEEAERWVLQHPSRGAIRWEHLVDCETNITFLS